MRDPPRALLNHRPSVGDLAPVTSKVGEAYPDSPKKNDAAIAAVMAWQARLDAVSKGAGRVASRAYAF